MLSAGAWNVLYACMAVGFVVVMMMISFQFTGGESSNENSTLHVASRLVQEAEDSVKAAMGASSAMEMGLKSQRAVSLLEAARAIIDDDELEQESGVMVRGLHDKARRMLKQAIRYASRKSAPENSKAL